MKISQLIRASNDKVGACEEFGIQIIEAIEKCFSTNVSKIEMLMFLSNRSELVKLHDNAKDEVKHSLAEFLNYDEVWLEHMMTYPLVEVAKLNQK